jgi:hypothetical protein
MMALPTFNPEDEPDGGTCPRCGEETPPRRNPRCDNCGWTLATDENYLASLDARAEARKEVRGW